MLSLLTAYVITVRLWVFSKVEMVMQILQILYNVACDWDMCKRETHFSSGKFTVIKTLNNRKFPYLAAIQIMISTMKIMLNK